MCPLLLFEMFPFQETDLRMKVHVTNPALYLLEDPSNVETRALVFRSTFLLNWTMKGDLTDVTYHMKDLEAYKCRLINEQVRTSIFFTSLF